MEKIYNYIIEFGINFIEAIILLIIGFKLIKYVLEIIKKGKGFKKLEPSVQTFLISFINIALRIVIIISACALIGIPMTSMLALLSSAALAIGLSLQGSLSNLAGGLMILLFKPFKVGDYINTHSDEGTVVDITLFYTTIITIDNKSISLPNGNLANSPIINYTKLPKRRVDIIISTSYNNDIEKIKKILNTVADNNDLIFKEDRIIRLTKHNENSLDFAVRVWCNTENYFDVYYYLLEEIKKMFDKNNIEIPYPQLDVHLDK